MSEIEKVYNEDGEVRLLINPLTHKPISIEQTEAFKRQKEKGKDTRHFTFADMESLQEVISCLSNVHLGYLLHLQCFISLETGYLHNQKGMVMTKKVDIEKALGITESTSKRLCRALEDNGILEVVEGKFRINPKYHFKGQANDLKVIKLFTTTLKGLCKSLNANELGFLYKLLPYVHMKTNMICINPFEIDPEKIKFLNVKCIAEIINMEEKKVGSLISKLRKSKIIVEVVREDKRNTFITLNPYIFYRISGQPDDTLKAMFASSPYSSKK